MNTYQRGVAINLVQRFWTIDPLTGNSILTNPATVTFTVKDPDNVEVSYVFGVDANVANPSVGIFVCALGTQLPLGTYAYNCVGTDLGVAGVDAQSSDFFDVIGDGVQVDGQPTVAIDGPCSSWVNGDDVANFGGEIVDPDFHWLLDDVAYQASALLYALTGRQYPGVCEQTVRPCRDTCGCWGGVWSSGLGWSWAQLSYQGGNGFWNWGWFNTEGGSMSGCGYDSFVRLAGYPVRKILWVRIDGVDLPEFDVVTGFRNWRLDGRDELWRMDDPSTDPAQPRHWPACQNQSLDDDQPGTFAVRYSWGADAPPGGRAAACALARQLWKAQNTGTCDLPNKVTKVVRAGITMERITSIAEMLRAGATGIQAVDAFLAQANPTKMIRRPAVFSPDLQPYARRVGQDN